MKKTLLLISIFALTSDVLGMNKVSINAAKIAGGLAGGAASYIAADQLTSPLRRFEYGLHWFEYGNTDFFPAYTNTIVAATTALGCWRGSKRAAMSMYFRQATQQHRSILQQHPLLSAKFQTNEHLLEGIKQHYPAARNPLSAAFDDLGKARIGIMESVRALDNAEEQALSKNLFNAWNADIKKTIENTKNQIDTALNTIKQHPDFK